MISVHTAKTPLAPVHALAVLVVIAYLAVDVVACS